MWLSDWCALLCCQGYIGLLEKELALARVQLATLVANEGALVPAARVPRPQHESVPGDDSDLAARLEAPGADM